jgi:hypothetical protein
MHSTSTTSRRSSGDRTRRSGRPPAVVHDGQPTPRAHTASRRGARRAENPLQPVPAVIDLSKVDLDELDIGSLTVDRSEHLRLDGDHAVSARETDPLAQGLLALLRNDCHADRLQSGRSWPTPWTGSSTTTGAWHSQPRGCAALT